METSWYTGEVGPHRSWYHGTVATGEHTWICPACGRRVPLRASACHCGMTRERAEAEARARLETEAEVERAVARRPRPGARLPRVKAGPLPSDVKGLLIGVALVTLVGLGWLAFGPQPEPIVPVLGFVDAGPPPAVKPTPPPAPPFKLPWWK